MTAMIGFGGVALGTAASSVTTIIITQQERLKFRSERSWDLRREAYTKIVGALDRARAITQYIDDGYDDRPEAWDQAEANRKAQAKMVEFFHAARIEFHASRLMLSAAFVAKYEEMNFGLEEANNQNLIPPETAEMAANVMKRLIPEMEELAKRELGVDF
jgi:hypothetical protein